MTKTPLPVARIGIIGGGQLGRMLVRKAHQLGCTAIVLDPTPNSPAGQIADAQILGGFFDRDKIRELVEQVDVTTYDLENIDAEFLALMSQEGHRILPDPNVLANIQDKLVQKQIMQDFGLPTSPFKAIPEPKLEDFVAFGFPLVQKARRGGYDGRGVAVLRSEADWPKHLPVPGFAEQYIPFEKELAVLVARSTTGETKVYPVCEMGFSGEANIMEMLLVPAALPEATTQKAQELAIAVMECFQGVGIFGVELFLTQQGDLLINEISPRTHNSGHYTIEACVTDQFEQHLRAILGLPLGDSSQIVPAALINLLGEPGHSGTPMLVGMHEALRIPGVSIHLYGKAKTAPYRKMGHVTVIDQDLDKAREKAMLVKNTLRITAEP
ncbi:MAG: 5-(carboxyamino)imidazole ribonucleotide synthase [Bacteroidetes bacterium]|nr:5-(carboxyamino)imidazole ribonucleotide synthase [Bacteroidota bacterium]